MIRNRLLPQSRRTHATTTTTDDADAAAGTSTTNNHHHNAQQQQHPMTIPPPLSCDSSIASTNFASAPPSGNLEFFEDLVSEPVLVLGVDISHFSRKGQFIVCASGVFVFSLLYGFLQELISVTLLDRKLGLFLATMQFTGYVFWAFLLQRYVYGQKGKSLSARYSSTKLKDTPQASPTNDTTTTSDPLPQQHKKLLSSSYPPTTKEVPLMMYLGLSLLRAVDLGMTNLAMQYINYPAKTLMKSSRVVFTMLFGVLILRKRYRWKDYCVVALMVSGLIIFMHADAYTSAVFHHLGIIMLTISLLCDGAITNMSESIMNQFGVGQDEFILNMYSIALVAISLAALAQGDFQEGLRFLGQTGKYGELHLPLEERSAYWTPLYKIGVLILFSTMGFFGSSCSAAITKNFGAMTMSLTSTVRKATTLFISFAIFDNECTMEHVTGIALFMSALVMKTLCKSSSSRKSSSSKSRKGRRRKLRSSLNLESLATNNNKLDVALGSADPTSAPHKDSSTNAEETANLLEMPTFRGDNNHVYVA